MVAPLVGAWIEMPMGVIKNNTPYVAPLVGAWIEIGINGKAYFTDVSLPLWERGLK